MRCALSVHVACLYLLRGHSAALAVVLGTDNCPAIPAVKGDSNLLSHMESLGLCSVVISTDVIRVATCVFDLSRQGCAPCATLSLFEDQHGCTKLPMFHRCVVAAPVAVCALQPYSNLPLQCCSHFSDAMFAAALPSSHPQQRSSVPRQLLNALMASASVQMVSLGAVLARTVAAVGLRSVSKRRCDQNGSFSRKRCIA